MPPNDSLESSIGHRFANPALLEMALTHASHPTVNGTNNQRLEFLGDRILGMLIAERLYKNYPDADEGNLHRRYEALVRRDTCAEAARFIGLGDHLRLSQGERLAGGSDKTSILSDAIEALVAAVYLDGGVEAAAGLIERIWTGDSETAPLASAKSRLQEWSQKRRMGLPKYHVSPHGKGKFYAVVSIEDDVGLSGSGAGRTFRDAQQAAAQSLLDRLSDDK